MQYYEKRGGNNGHQNTGMSLLSAVVQWMLCLFLAIELAGVFIPQTLVWCHGVQQLLQEALQKPSVERRADFIKHVGESFNVYL